MTFLDLIDLGRLRKIILYLFVILGGLWLQTGFFSRIAPLGVKPFFLPVIAVAIGLWEGGVWGGILGMLTGLMCDLNLIESTVTYLVLFALFGFAAGLLGQFFINRRFFAAMLISAAALAVTIACQIVPLWIFRSVSIWALFPVMLLQFLWSLPFAMPAYFAAKKISQSN